LLATHSAIALGSECPRLRLLDIEWENVYPEIESAIMRISKWGNSLAVRLPAMMVTALELFALRKKPDSEAAFERLRTFRGRLPADFKFNRDEVHTRS